MSEQAITKKAIATHTSTINANDMPQSLFLILIVDVPHSLRTTRLLHVQVSKEEAEKRIRAIKEPYKLEILDSIAARHPDAPITIYHLGKEGQGEHWWDLCAGPHVETTKQLNPAAVELESIAGVSD